MREHIERHYTHGDVVQAIQNALREAGKDPANLAPSDLAAVDEFHVRGREASLELAQELPLNETVRVLDVGCGLGGSSRTLASPAPMAARSSASTLPRRTFGELQRSLDGSAWITCSNTDTAMRLICLSRMRHSKSPGPSTSP